MDTTTTTATADVTRMSKEQVQEIAHAAITAMLERSPELKTVWSAFYPVVGHKFLGRAIVGASLESLKGEK